MSDSSSISSGNNKITIDKNIKNNLLKTGYKNNRIKILTTDNFILDGIPIKKKKNNLSSLVNSGEYKFVKV